MYHSDDTIVAAATPAAGAARAIVRLSGPRVVAILSGCFCPHDSLELADFREPMVVGGKLSLAGGEFAGLEADLYLWPDRRSYTRQPVAELHLLGAVPIVASLMRNLLAHGARLAQPGEFTLRAFLAGRLDLTQAEAVLGVIEASGADHLRLSLRQLAGGMVRPLDRLRDQLLDLLAHLEAGLDFVEEDIEFVSKAQVSGELTAALKVVLDVERQLRDRVRQHHLPRVVLVGPPNAGKSSLFNVLTGGAQAIVSHEPGTTRDYLTATVELDGVSCQLIDTAGADASPAAGEIESAAQRHSVAQSQAGDVRLVCADKSASLSDRRAAEARAAEPGRALLVWTKADLTGPRDKPGGAENDGKSPLGIATSARSGEGIAALRQQIRSALVEARRAESAIGMTSHRCADSIRGASEALTSALAACDGCSGDELIAADIRLALDEIGKVVGAVYTDDILDRIFSRFCIGK